MVVSSPHPITLAVITWNMHAGAGDLPRLVDDLVSGRLTGVAPSDYVLLLQEAYRGSTHGNRIVGSLPLRDERTIALPRERQARSALAAAIDVAGARLFIVNVHFENRLGLWRGLFSDTARGRQARALLRELPTGPGIAGGDFNTWLGQNEPAWKVFAERFPDTPAGRLEPTFRDRLVLDHLFVDLPDGWRVERRVVRETYGSDHHPVIALITASS